MELFPINKKMSGQYKKLGKHYEQTLVKLGHDPENIPDSLFFTFCGDILGSSGEHYEKGKPIQFEVACSEASLAFSDDFMESLAMHLMKDRHIELDTISLVEHKEYFFDLIADHFESLSQSYSPWFGSIRNAKEPQEFIQAIIEHGSCGAAMRAAILAANHLKDSQALLLLMITHLHIEALEGGFWVKGFAEAAMEGKSFAEAMERGLEKSLIARKKAQEFQFHVGLKKQDYAPLHSFIDKTLAQNNPYASIDDIAEEGIETRFVVSAVMYILDQIHDNGKPEIDIPKLITQTLEIGGDPDTIASIGLSLYGLRWPDETKEYLRQLVVGKP